MFTGFTGFLHHVASQHSCIREYACCLSDRSKINRSPLLYGFSPRSWATTMARTTYETVCLFFSWVIWLLWVSPWAFVSTISQTEGNKYLYKYYYHCSRMHNFENDLNTTVDNILLLLGHKPSMTKHIPDPSQVLDVHPVTSQLPPVRKGPRLVKSPSDLARLLEKMWDARSQKLETC